MSLRRTSHVMGTARHELTKESGKEIAGIFGGIDQRRILHDVDGAGSRHRKLSDERHDFVRLEAAWPRVLGCRCECVVHTSMSKVT